MKRLLREEHQPIRIVKDEGEDGITDNQLERLIASWRATTGRDPGKAFEYGQGFVKPTNWVGSVSVGDFLVEVVPRGALALGEDDRQELDRNLGEMLHLALGAEPLSFGSGQVNPRGSRFERAVESLCELVRVARRKQVLRAYRVRDEISRNARGALRFPAQGVVAQQRPGFTACRWVELSEDTPENRFLKRALSVARKRVGGSLRRQVDEALVSLENATEVSNPLLEYDRIQLGRLSPEYAQAIELAKNVLEGTAGGILAGSLASRSEVVFLPDLFQGFVGRLARDFATKQGLECRLEARGRHLSRWRSGPFQGIDLVELIPDVELLSPPSLVPVAVLDAKWKALRPAVPSLGISATDIHQLLAYSNRLSCGHSALVYPWLARHSPFSEVPVMQVGQMPQRIGLMVICLPLLWESLDEVVAEFSESLVRLLALT